MAILFGSIALADCASSGIWIKSSHSVLRQNSLIFVEGYYLDEPVVSKFGKETTIKLVSKDHTVELEQVNMYEGMMHLTTVVLRPKELLKINNTYSLSIKDPENPERPTLKRYNPDSGEYENYKWDVLYPADQVAPSWITKPAHKKNSYVAFGCGPAVNAHFTSTYSDKSPTWVLVELQEKGRDSYLYPVQLNKEGFEFGHGMCSGGFRFTSKKEYSARFKLYDESGNTASEWTTWMNFKNPYDHYESEW